jgi:F0F1-type ATP synthase assembly protein I
MIDFVLAGLIYLVLMFAVLFCFSFITIGITYAAVSLVRRCVCLVRQPHLAIK